MPIVKNESSNRINKWRHLEENGLSGTIGPTNTVGNANYFGGEFTHVYTYVQVGTNLTTNVNFAANNIFKFTPSTATLDAMVGTGGTRGVSGRVLALTHASNGDLYVGGEFLSAGGNPYSVNIACWKNNQAWNLDTIFAAYNTGAGDSFVDELSWNGGVLIVDGEFNYAVTQHPSPYTSYNTWVYPDNVVYLYNTSYGFNYLYWVDPNP